MAMIKSSAASTMLILIITDADHTSASTHKMRIRIGTFFLACAYYKAIGWTNLNRYRHICRDDKT